MIVAKEIQDVVRATLGKEFPKMKVLRITVSEHVTDSSTQVLEIKVVFDAKKGDFDPAKLSGLPRLIMPKLVGLKENGFPLFSFIAKSDLGNMSPAAA